MAIAVTLNPAGCEKGDDQSATPAPSELPKGSETMNLTITSSAFNDGSAIPVKYTGDGADVSPSLTFLNIPAGTEELAMICDDPDAPRPDPWVHWIIYKIPAETTELQEGIKISDRQPVTPTVNVQGLNSSNTIGYRGPAPPPGHGVHHYHFKLYALDDRLDVKESMDKAALLKAMEGHILAEAELIGTYKR